MNPSPAGTLENSPAIHRWGMARKQNESRQGRKKSSCPSEAFFRPSGACSLLPSQPTVETVGYYRSSLTGLVNARDLRKPRSNLLINFLRLRLRRGRIDPD